MLVHHVVIKLTCGLIQVGINVLYRLAILDLRDHDHALLVGREHKALDAILDIADAVAATAVGVHCPQLWCLALAFLTIDKGDLLATINPHIVALAVRSVGDLAGILAVNVHDPQVAVALVGSDVIIGHAIEHLLAIGRHLGSTHAAQLIEEFGSELFLFHFTGSFLGSGSLTRSCRFLLGAGRGTQQGQRRNRHCC